MICAANGGEAAAKAKERERFKGIKPLTAINQAAKDVLKSFGGFSVADLNRRIASPKDFQMATADNTKKTAELRLKVVRILPTIGPKFT